MDNDDGPNNANVLTKLGILAGYAVALGLTAAAADRKFATRRKRESGQRKRPEGRSRRTDHANSTRTYTSEPPPPMAWDEVLTRAEYEQKLEFVREWRSRAEELAKNPANYPPPSEPIFRDTHTVLKAYGQGGWGPMPRLTIVCHKCLRYLGRQQCGFGSGTITEQEMLEFARSTCCNQTCGLPPVPAEGS